MQQTVKKWKNTLSLKALITLILKTCFAEITSTYRVLKTRFAEAK